MRYSITDKLNELAEQALSCDEKNIAIVLFALVGANKCGEDGALAAKVQEFVKDFLIPKCEQEIENKIASQN